MTRPGADRGLERAGERLGPYARFSLERARRYALRLHADELTSEHLLASLLEDESCAATALVLHAFADPATVGGEVLALCPGIMVVGSGRSLPFSMGALAALRSARALAAARGSSVTPPDLFQAVLLDLPQELFRRLFPDGERARPLRPPPEPSGLGAGSLFHSHGHDSLRALGAACRAAAKLERDAIGPVHLLAGALEVDAELARAENLTPARLRLLLAGCDEDRIPLPARELAPDPRLAELLAGLPPGAGTLEILGELLRAGSEELRALLLRQKITPALFERSRGAFRDPEPPGVGVPP
jgi:hypothetical protein